MALLAVSGLRNSDHAKSLIAELKRIDFLLAKRQLFCRVFDDTVFKRISIIRNSHCYARWIFLRRSGRPKDSYPSVFHLHPVNKNNSFAAGFGCSSVIHAEHFFTIGRVRDAVVTRARYKATFVCIFLQYRVIGRFFIRTKWRCGCGVSNGIIPAAEMIGRVHDVICIVFFKRNRSFRPAAAHFAGRYRPAFPLSLLVA